MNPDTTPPALPTPGADAPDGSIVGAVRQDGSAIYIAAIREGEVVVVEAVRKRGDIIYRTRVLRMER